MCLIFSVFALCSPAIVLNRGPKCKERKIASGNTKSINKLFNSKVSSCPNTAGINQVNKVQGEIQSPRIQNGQTQKLNMRELEHKSYKDMEQGRI